MITVPEGFFDDHREYECQLYLQSSQVQIPWISAPVSLRLSVQ